MRLSIVTIIPMYPAWTTGCSHIIEPFPAGGNRMRINPNKNGNGIPNSSAKGTKSAPSGASGSKTDNLTPIMVTIMVATNPIKGPLIPRSNRESLLGGNDFSWITAPNVPKGGNPGIKYGYVASIL